MASKAIEELCAKSYLGWKPKDAPVDGYYFDSGEQVVPLELVGRIVGELEAQLEQRLGELERQNNGLRVALATSSTEREGNMAATIEQQEQRIGELEAKLAAFADAAIKERFSHAEYGTPGRIIGYFCKLCGSDGKTADSVMHDSECPMKAALENSKPVAD